MAPAEQRGADPQQRRAVILRVIAKTVEFFTRLEQSI